MEYQSNHSSNSASTASNDTANTVSATRRNRPTNENPERQQQQPQTAKEVIAANVKCLIEQLEAGRSDALTAYLDAMSRFHRYSFGNVLEIARQRPDSDAVVFAVSAR